MRYVKTLAATAVAAAALLAAFGTGTASAAGVICSTETNPCTSKWPNGTSLAFSLASGTSAKFTTTEGTVLDTCTGGTITGSLTNGSSTTNASYSVATSGLTWSGCTVTTTTTEGGTFQVESVEAGNGTVFAIGFKITINTSLFGSCTFSGGVKIHFGKIIKGIGSAVKKVVRAIFGRESGLCPSTAKFEAEYALTAPSATRLYVATS